MLYLRRSRMILLATALLLASCRAVPSDATTTSTHVPVYASESSLPHAPSPRATHAGASGTHLSVDDVQLQIHDLTPKSLVIRSDGTIVFTAGDRAERETVAPQALAELQRVIGETAFSALREQYRGTECCDVIAHTITVVTAGNRHSVYCYNACPPEFDRVKDAILRLWPGTIEYQGWS